MTAPRMTRQKTIMKGIQTQFHPSIMCTLTPFRRAVRIAALRGRGIRSWPHTLWGNYGCSDGASADRKLITATLPSAGRSPAGHAKPGERAQRLAHRGKVVKSEYLVGQRRFVWELIRASNSIRRMKRRDRRKVRGLESDPFSRPFLCRMRAR